MKSFHLELNDVDDFIPELAKQFETDFSECLGEYSMEIPQSIGSGNINGINFPNGIGLFTYHCKLHESIKFKTRLPNINPIRFIYCVEGKVESYFNEGLEQSTITDHQYLIAAPKADDTHYVSLKKNCDIAVCCLELDRKKFKEYFSFNLDELEPVFYEIFSDLEAEKRISSIGSFSLKTAETIKEIKNCRISGFPRVNFVGAKALEILSYMLTRFKREGQLEDHRVLREKEVKAIEEVTRYIDENISKVGTVNDLAKVGGMNSNKLQEIFQTVYGKTVNEYLRDIRLSKALDMLSNGKKNVSEVVYELGLSSRSYFSKIFKAKYGISPRKILNQDTTEDTEIRKQP